MINYNQAKEISYDIILDVTFNNISKILYNSQKNDKIDKNNLSS